MATKKLAPKSSKSIESTDKAANKAAKVKPVINALVPAEVANETNTALVLSSEPSEKAVPIKAIPEGYANYTAVDKDGTVFVTCQSAERGYISALLVDSPMGRIVARWSRDHKGLVRIANRIAAGTWSTPGMSAAYVADVKVASEVPQSATLTTRRAEVEYYARQGLIGPNHHARELAKMQRLAQQAALLAQSSGEFIGPIQQTEQTEQNA